MSAAPELAAELRRRYECTCGFHGYREGRALPAHIPCPRCGGVAVAFGPPELVTRPLYCGHVYCLNIAALELTTCGQPLEADRLYSQKRLVRCRL